MAISGTFIEIGTSEPITDKSATACTLGNIAPSCIGADGIVMTIVTARKTPKKNK